MNYRTEESFKSMWDHWLPREMYFCGIRIQQGWTTLFLLEDILNREQDITTIVELGTGHGGLTLFFGLHMKDRGRVLTFDTVDQLSFRWHMLAHSLPITFLEQDVMSEQVIKDVSKYVKTQRVLVFCDAGEKELRVPQFYTYAKMLKQGDIIMAHDYYNSILPSDIRLVQKDIPLEHYRQEDFDNLKTFTVCLQRV